MERVEAFELVKKHMKNKNLIKHVLAVEAIMRALAEFFSEDIEEWGLAGLLHDLDYEQTLHDPDNHSLHTERILQDKDISGKIIYAIKCHNLKAERKSLLDKALYAADPVSGFIVAAALMHPEKKLGSLDLDFMLRRYKTKSFAAGASREQIETCQAIGLTLNVFLKIALSAMQEQHAELGL